MNKTKAATSPTASRALGRVQRRRDRRKAEITRTATEILASSGYQGTSLEEVAERSDIAKATLYHYFASKDDLVLAALESLAVEVLSRLTTRAEATSDTTATGRLRALIDEQILILTETAPEVATIFSWPHTWPRAFDEPMKDMRRRHDAMFRSIIEDGVKSGEFTCQDVNVALQCMHGILNQSSVWLRPGSGDLSAVRARAVDCALRLFV